MAVGDKRINESTSLSGLARLAIELIGCRRPVQLEQDAADRADRRELHVLSGDCPGAKKQGSGKHELGYTPDGGEWAYAMEEGKGRGLHGPGRQGLMTSRAACV